MSFYPRKKFKQTMGNGNALNKETLDEQRHCQVNQTRLKVDFSSWT
jgi:hypothetical protein